MRAFTFIVVLLTLTAAAQSSTSDDCDQVSKLIDDIKAHNCGFDNVCPKTTVPPTTTSSSQSTGTSKTTAAPPVPGGSGGCWARTGWSTQECKQCPTPAEGNKCQAFQWTDCYDSEAKCNKGNGFVGSCDDLECPATTAGMTRPNFRGPHCYNNQHGSQFGPSWKPSGKTAFEKYIRSPTDMYKILQVINGEVPALQPSNTFHPSVESWNLVKCEAATAIFENFVCSLELIEVKNRKFYPPRSGVPGADIREFANNGDDQMNRREIAAFFSHKFKETGLMTGWIEPTSEQYAQPHDVYPPVPGKSYCGRGPVQISYNFNYGAFSEWFFGDKSRLLSNPEMVDPQGPMGFIAAMWFWFSPRQFSSGAPISGTLRTRDAIIHWTDGKMNDIYRDGVDYDAYAGLGLSTNVINGGVECSGDGSWANFRVSYFMSVASRMGVTIPDTSNKAACLADKYCRGLFSGCRSTAGGLRCSSKNLPCGPAFQDGWLTNLCVP